MTAAAVLHPPLAPRQAAAADFFSSRVPVTASSSPRSLVAQLVLNLGGPGSPARDCGCHQGFLSLLAARFPRRAAVTPLRSGSPAPSGPDPVRPRHKRALVIAAGPRSGPSPPPRQSRASSFRPLARSRSPQFRALAIPGIPLIAALATRTAAAWSLAVPPDTYPHPAELVGQCSPSRISGPWCPDRRSQAVGQVLYHARCGAGGAASRAASEIAPDPRRVRLRPTPLAAPAWRAGADPCYLPFPVPHSAAGHDCRHRWITPSA